MYPESEGTVCELTIDVALRKCSMTMNIAARILVDIGMILRGQLKLLKTSTTSLNIL
jgi:hypothetical protein